MSITRHHIEWLSLVPNSGPFLSLPVLAQTFPQGLDAHDADHARRLRMAFNEWDDNQSGIHRTWIKLVLAETLGYDELLAEKQAIPQTIKSELAEYGITLRPDWIVNDPATKKARLLVQTYPRSQSLTKPVATSRWKTSPDTRMMQLLHDTGIRLGIVTNGDHWMLVNAPKNETTGYASWHANLWLEEPVTLRAFRTVLGADRLFSVPEGETLEALLDKSANDQQEVTDQLGYQVRKAVEVAIQALDKADQDHGRKLLADVDEKILYESALTVMMRLVFLFCAEERELLLLGDELYDENYAVSTLREQLRGTADEFGEEILGLRYDAWTRLLTTFRAVYAGAKHDRLKLPAYGGSLFNPDRFPFLEGRKLGTTWRTAEATPLPVSNRTVLHLLEALQVLQTKVGNTTEARKLSFRALDIEQIGHVYEGLLDHTAKRATEPMLGLSGTRDKEPEIPLSELEKCLATEFTENTEENAKARSSFLSVSSVNSVAKYLTKRTGRNEAALKKGLNAKLDDQLLSRFRTACQDSDLWKRVKPFAGLVRLDDVDYPVVITTGSIFVTAGTDRRSSGTHYTPKSLTEPIVQYTLEPLVYIGPAEGLPKEQWKLRSAKELLDLKICDMACGSGAFLVQACRYLAERLMEAWEIELATEDTENTENKKKDKIGFLDLSSGLLTSASVSSVSSVAITSPDELQVYARRIIAQRCLYGVDKNPLAVEMAKLSLWLLTLAKYLPFEFLDHAIRCGDSLVGVHDFKQLERLHLDAEEAHAKVYQEMIRQRIDAAVGLRRKIAEMTAATVEDTELQGNLLHQAEREMDRLHCGADLLVAEAFGADLRAWSKVNVFADNSDLQEYQNEANRTLAGRETFHWPLEFPEVFSHRDHREHRETNTAIPSVTSVSSVANFGFDALVGNPPFMGGQKITGNLGNDYREYVVKWLAGGRRGSADLCAYFLLRAGQLVRHGGGFGLLATNTIAQGDTREVGLEQLSEDGCVIPRAVPSRPWPGSASLEVAHVWLRRGTWAGPFLLDDKPSNGITAFLTAPGTVAGNPHRLKANEGKSFQGSIVLGMGFVLEPEEAQRLIDKDARNKDVLFPYLNGEDLNSRPDQSPSRWVINFFDWPIEKAMQYPDCFRIIEDKVKPERMKNNRKVYRDRWWHYAEKRPELYRTIAGMERVFAGVLHTKFWSVADYSPELVFSHALAVFAVSSFHSFAVLESFLHESWTREYSGSLETRLRYTPSDCFETFPFPSFSVPSVSSVANLGERYHTHRQQIMLARQEGLTRTYNRFHNADEESSDIVQLRQLHVEMDNAVAAAYGWSDVDLGHGFHQTKQGRRYTISESARREVLARLLTLNHARYADEVKQGLHAKKKPRKTRKKADEGGGMFG